MSPSSEDLARRVARHVLTKTLRVGRGDNVTIESWSLAVPWAVPFVEEARRLGAHPLLLYEDEAAFWKALRTGASRATGEVGSHEWGALEDTDAYVFFFGPGEWPRYDGLRDNQTAGVSAYNAEWYRRAAKAQVRAARMYLGRTSPLSARRWGVDLDAWRTALQRASLASPEAMRRLGERIGRRLERGKRVRVAHPNGTKLEFALGGFPLQIDDALVDDRDLKVGNNVASIPGGVVGVATDHTSTQGTVVGNHTVYPSSGPAAGIRWTFEDGRLASSSYRKGGRAFAKAYAEAPAGGRDRMSYFSVGLNPELADCPQMEDQELGAVMLRLGGNVFAGGKNRSPFGSWLTLNGANVSVDGAPLLKRGRVV